MATGNSDLLVMCCMFRWNYGGITEMTTNAKRQVTMEVLLDVRTCSKIPKV